MLLWELEQANTSGLVYTYLSILTHARTCSHPPSLHASVCAHVQARASTGGRLCSSHVHTVARLLHCHLLRLSLLGLSQAVQGISGKGSWNSGERGSGEGQGPGCREGKSKGVQEGWGLNLRTGGWAGGCGCGGGNVFAKLSEDFVLRAWTFPGSPRPPRCSWSPEAGRDLGLFSGGRERGLLPSAWVQVHSTGLQRDPLGILFCL